MEPYLFDSYANAQNEPASTGGGTTAAFTPTPTAAAAVASTTPTAATAPTSAATNTSQPAPTIAKITKAECLALAARLSDMTQLPVACRPFVVNAQYEGASHKERVSGAKVAFSGRRSHAQLQVSCCRTEAVVLFFGCVHDQVAARAFAVFCSRLTCMNSCNSVFFFSCAAETDAALSWGLDV